MSESSPSDLAVAFRGFPRRLGEALDALSGEAERRAQPHARAVHDAIAQAAAALAVPSTGAPAAVAAAVADRISAVHPDAWDDVTLGALRRHALAIGASLRAIADLAP